MDIAVALVKLQWKWRTLLNAIAWIANLYKFISEEAGSLIECTADHPTQHNLREVSFPG